MLVFIVIADPGRIDRRSARLRVLTILLIAVMTVANSLGAILLIYDIIAAVRGITFTNLLGRGALSWLTNVIVFSLWYWEVDRGGPAKRAARLTIRPSLAFPEDAFPEMAAEGWEPSYPDYLYFSFTNATAFSPTDTLPLTLWAKALMGLQSAVALGVVGLVIARAVNILS